MSEPESCPPDEATEQADPTAAEDAPEAEEPALAPEEQELAALRQELRDNTARLRTVSVAYRKLQEEFSAFRDRQAKQIEIRQETLKGDTVQRLFEPMDNLRRSIDALTKAGVGDDALSGLEMVWRDFLAGFHDLGLQEIGQEGEVFDPDQHEALTLMPVPSAELDNKVVSVFSKGYRVGSRLIRPARVVIGQHHEEPVAEA